MRPSPGACSPHGCGLRAGLSAGLAGWSHRRDRCRHRRDATGIGGRTLAARRTAASDWPPAASVASGLRRRRRQRTLPRNRAGHRIQTLFQHGDAGIQPVAIAVQRLDGGGQPPRLVLAFLGDRLDLLRLPRQIGGRDLLAPHRRSRTGWRARRRRRRRPRPAPHDPSRHSARRSNSSSSAKNPLSKPPVFSVSKLPARWSGSLCHTTLSALLRPRRITRQTLTGNAPPILNPAAIAGWRIGFPCTAKTLYDGGGSYRPRNYRDSDDRSNQPHRSCSRPARARACAPRCRRCCIRWPANRCWRMCSAPPQRAPAPRSPW